MKHQFALILTDYGSYEDATERLFEAGCDDASPILTARTFRLEFRRESPTFREAVLSAIRDAEAAGTTVQNVETDELVTASEIGRRTERSRETIRLYANGQRGPGGFPKPITGTQHYEWRKVAAWFNEHDVYPAVVDPHAEDVAAINHVLELRRLVPTQRELVELWRAVHTTKS